MFACADVVLCKSAEVTRERGGKWRIKLKEGVANLAGNDLLFKECNSDLLDFYWISIRARRKAARASCFVVYIWNWSRHHFCYFSNPSVSHSQLVSLKKNLYIFVWPTALKWLKSSKPGQEPFIFNHRCHFPSGAILCRFELIFFPSWQSCYGL